MKKSIAFVTAGLQFNGHSLSSNALGGSESALIYMAKHLAELNNNVMVFCDCDKPGIYDNVEYYHYNDFMNDKRSQYDVVVISRYTEFLIKYPVDSKLNILWCHDTHTPFFKESLGMVDAVFLLSNYQKQLYIDQFKIIDPSIIHTTTNGFDSSLVHDIRLFDDRKNNYIYASRPERGLLRLLQEVWPRIIKMNPDAVLNLCGYNSFSPTEELKKYYDDCKWAELHAPNIINHGQLTKQEYYELLQSCAYMVYPTDFPEISCINAIEAQANGCLVIATDDFALSETVKSNTLCKPSTDDFMKLVELYQNEHLWNVTTAITKSKIESYAWENIAKDWDKKMDELFQQRYAQYKPQIINQLVYNSDIVAASKFDKSVECIIEQANTDNITVSTYISMDHEFAALSDRGIKLLGIVQELIEANPTKKLRILDVGCNDGILSLPLLKEFGDNIETLYAIDMSTDILQFLTDRWKPIYPQLTPLQCNACNIDQLGLTDIDIVICGEILEHIEHTTMFLDRLMTTGNDNTTFFFTVPKGPWESIIKDSKEFHHIHHFEYTDIIEIFGDINITKTQNRAMGRRGEECSNYAFWFTGNKRTFNQPDYEAKLVKTRPYKTISVCMIVKNEEDNLSRCLKTVVPFSDEIIIVDTGSLDDTKRIAKKFTNNVYDLVWEEADGLGNFARARNYSIQHATGDYIFWIDADEQIENYHVMFKFLQSDYYDSILLKQKHVLPRDRHSGDINVDPYPDRLFKNNGKMKFEGVIHEFVAMDGDWVKKCLFQDQVWILHYGNTNLELLKSKSLGRNPQLIEKNAKLYPNSIMAKHYQVVDCWSKFVTEPSPTLLNTALTLWHEHFVDCSDKFAQYGTFAIIQKFYEFVYNNKLADGLQPYQFSNGTESIEFFAHANEVDLFLKILTQ